MLLNVIVPVYNHGDYMGQAIESVLMQKVDFREKLQVLKKFGWQKK